jgi:hypothetical protein
MNENFLASGTDLSCLLYYMKSICVGKQTKKEAFV